MDARQHHSKSALSELDERAGSERSGIRRATGHISGVTVPALSRTLVSSGIMMLRELVNVPGSDLSRAEDLAARLGNPAAIETQLQLVS
ncbi:hypothetical protein QTP86_031610, partial [Hemibagrus guttatus]